MINALTGNPAKIHNLSTARDTVIMKRELATDSKEIDAEDAGTVMRFITAYLSLKGVGNTITGSERMKHRPIGILVDALNELGARISYLDKPGYPPHKIDGPIDQQKGELEIDAAVSSQYISAIMMIAPLLPLGLTIHLKGRVSSRPYLEVTRQVMEDYGASVDFTANTIRIDPGSYIPREYAVEPDWSSAGYWFAIAATSRSGTIELVDLSTRSSQADKLMFELSTSLGIVAESLSNGIKVSPGAHSESVDIDFTGSPDLAQTVAVLCAAQGIRGRFTGLESLRIKETDRIAALNTELHKIGASLKGETGEWFLEPTLALPSSARISTYDDHRMAMAFAILATKMDVEIEDPEVVNKSYPGFWDDLRKAGFRIETT